MWGGNLMVRNWHWKPGIASSNLVHLTKNLKENEMNKNEFSAMLSGMSLRELIELADARRIKTQDIIDKSEVVDIKKNIEKRLYNIFAKGKKNVFI